MKAKRLLAAVLIIVMLLSMSAFSYADSEIETTEQNAVELEDSSIQEVLTADVDTTNGGGDSPESEDPVEGIEPPVEAAETDESPDEAIAEISEFFVGFDGAASDMVYKDGTYTAIASVTPDEDEEFDAYSGTVTVVVKDGKINAVSFDGDYDEDNDTYVGYALNGRTRKGTTYASVPSQIIAANSAEGIDAVSGATCVSNAIAETVAVILNGDAAADPASSDGYVLMNIPYAEFYAAEGTADVDAITSATLNKPRTIGLAGGSYHVNADGSDITGVIYPVYVADMSVLSDYTQITDESAVTISVTNRGATTETTFEGKDALFEAPSYAYYVLSEEPTLYKTLNADGSFSAVNGAASTVTGVTADITYAGRHTDIEIPLEGTTGIETGDRVSGVVITVSDGSKYGLRHVYNIWRGTELGWNDDELDLYGKTITNIRYITESAVIDYSVEISFKLKGAEITAEFEDASTVTVAGLPDDIANATATVSSVVGRGETAVVLAENVEVKDGRIALTDAAADGTNYNVKVVSDNYADMTTRAIYAQTVRITADGRTAQVTGSTAGIYARVALVLSINGESGLYVTQAPINENGVIVIPAFTVPGMTVTGVNVSLVKTLKDITSPSPDVVSSDFILF